ncbi:retrovirus-related pol polyprotein [Plakobranchus ocellatus]|uniref:Retrovirus-related pol polyprotein n=1 Tax=Plakobranchus ocellatus TaxID=259542 RepID=A0AAV4CWV6_9GAST|nr:retrovirus-related pol polyprotein [Plakobranchus ocellatus]
MTIKTGFAIGQGKMRVNRTFVFTTGSMKGNREFQMIRTHEARTHELTVFSPTWHERHFGQRGQALQAANGTTISTFGSRDVKLRFHGTTYEARLIIADVKRPLLGADFFRRHNLLVDLNGQRLIEADSYLSSPCSTRRVTKTELAPIELDCNKFRKVLQEFPALLQPTFSSESVRHGVQRCIATSGPPVHSRARRLAPDKLAAAKKEIFLNGKNGYSQEVKQSMGISSSHCTKTQRRVAPMWRLSPPEQFNNSGSIPHSPYS